jgi:hypothetical protein
MKTKDKVNKSTKLGALGGPRSAPTLRGVGVSPAVARRRQPFSILPVSDILVTVH